MGWNDLIDEIQRWEAGDAEAPSRLRDRFERTQTVLVLDMAGFSRLTRQRGILHTLAMIHRMRSLCAPQVESVGGRLLKTEADNLLAVFPDVERGLRAALGMNIACAEDAALRGRSPEEAVRVCIGLGHGPMYDLGDDVFGDEVNLASKLGEDLAEPGEILLTRAAADLVPQRLEQHAVETRQTSISGVVVDYVWLATTS